jgi:Na+-transporting NADH:ubiquinone oxidoreductase subunit NqrC
MKALLKIVLVAAFYNVSLVNTSTSSELNHQFKNPAFSGQGYSSHVLSIEQLQHNREKENREKKAADEAAAKREEAQKTINKFLTNVESRIYANLSKQLVDNMFSTEAGAPTSGTTVVEGSTIYWIKDNAASTITVTITGADGNITNLTVPIGGFGF